MAPQVSLAAECPRFDLPPQEEAAFCEEFKSLLYAPYNPGTDRDAITGETQLNDVLGSNPLWGEVYRSDPKRTLDLIERIRAAGGLDTK